MTSTIKFQSQPNGKGIISYGLELIKDANIPHKYSYWGYFKLGNIDKWNNAILRFDVLTSNRIRVTIVSLAYGNYKLIGETEYSLKDNKWLANPYTDKWVKITNRAGIRNFDLNDDRQQTMYMNLCTLFDVLLRDFVQNTAIVHLLSELGYSEKRKELEWYDREIAAHESKLAELRNERNNLADSLAASETPNDLPDENSPISGYELFKTLAIGDTIELYGQTYDVMSTDKDYAFDSDDHPYWFTCYCELRMVLADSVSRPSVPLAYLYLKNLTNDPSWKFIHNLKLVSRNNGY